MREERNGAAAGRLDGLTAVIAGGTGRVGRVLVEGFLRAGARVVVPSRSEEKVKALLEGLRPEDGGRLIPLVGDLSDQEESARLVDLILDRIGRPDAAVASLGGFVPAPSVLGADVAELKQALDGYLIAHFMVAKALIPALKEGGSYTFINGPLAYQPMFPGTGLVSIATAAQAMLARAVMREEADGGLRINEVVIQTRFSDGEDNGRGPVSQEDVARYVIHLASERGSGVSGETIQLDSPDIISTLT